MSGDLQPEAKLATLCAGTAQSRAAGRRDAEGLIELVDWRLLATTLRQRRLLGLLGERILELAGARAPASFVARVHDSISETARIDASVELITMQLMASLKQAGIASVALKGPLLGRALYGELGRRASTDIDLLVGSEDLRRAVRIAEQSGYRHPEDRLWSDGLPLLHFTLNHRGPGVLPLELHWRIHWYEREFSRVLLSRSTEDGPRGLHPDPADELASLLLFYARDGFDDLRWACDLGTWWDRFGASLPAGAIEEHIARYPALERTLLAAISVADRVAGVPSSRLLAEPRRLESRVRAAIRLANPAAYGSAQQRSADVWLVDWLLTPPHGRRECLRRQLVSPAIANHGRTRRARAAVRLGRTVRILRRYALSLSRIALDSDHDEAGRIDLAREKSPPRVVAS